MNKITILLLILLSGCNFDLQKLTEDPKTRKKIEESKAIGAGCRESNKSIEDCFNLNEKFLKSEILNGWKEMDIYLRENKK